MIRIGLTGSIASGKTTASKIISRRRGPLFSADDVVKKLYKKTNFKKIVVKKFKIKSRLDLKRKIKNIILSKKGALKKLEQIIHPMVRKEMLVFLKKNKNKKFLFLEIPLLIESKLTRYFDVIIFIKSRKDLRIKRYISKGGKKHLFKVLDKQQLKDNKKIKYCDYVVVNNHSIKLLKKKLFNIIKIYE